LAVIDYRAELKAKKLIEAANNQAVERNQEAERLNEKRDAAAKMQRNISQARAKHQDIDSVIQGMSDAGINFADPVAIAIANSDHVADLIMHFGKTNPGDAFRISEMPLHAALVELGRIESTLSKGNGSPVKPTNAPAPGTPVVSDKPSQRDPYRIETSEADYIAATRRLPG
jgi:hypothetical protein